jgi:hypothetical protein
LIDEGARAWSIVLVNDANQRKNMDMASIIDMEIKRKKKNGPGCRRRFDMKYSVRLTKKEFTNLYGILMMKEDIASALGW